MDNTKASANKCESSEALGIKLPPHSTEAEQYLLGCLMRDGSTWGDVVDSLTEKDFYHREHRLIFKSLVALAENDQQLDVVMVSAVLDKNGLLEEVGGLAYLGEVAKKAPSVPNITALAQRIRDTSILRSLSAVSSEISDLTSNAQNMTVAEILSEAERKIFAISENSANKKGEPVSLGNLLTETIDRLDQHCNSGSSTTGLSTGFRVLDEMTLGLQPADLVIVAGRPSMGKTALAMNFVENAITASDRVALVFSIEMSRESLMRRMFSSMGGIDHMRMRAAQLTEEEWPKLTQVVADLNERNLYIDDSAVLSPMDVRARVRRVIREHGELSIIMIDSLQQMRSGLNTDNRTSEVTEISRSLKAVAKEFNVPVIALSQLNRSLEQRPNKRPVNYDLRDSGAIEEAADVIMFVYRDEVYNIDSADSGLAEIIIGKQRNGPIGTCKVRFNGKYVRFENLP